MEALEMLEERVQRVTDTVRALRRENQDLQARLREAEVRLGESAQAVAALEERGRQGDEVSRQLRLLQEERQEIRGRVVRMLETFSSLEEMAPTGHIDH
jgi:chromosome segregation ATPase